MIIDDIKEQLEAARVRARENSTSENNAEVKRLQAMLGAIVADGADPCQCGAPPHGIEQPRGNGREVVTEYEIGCLRCPVRARAKTRRGAVLLWNAGEYGK
jgi:hypothetical protein